MLVLKIVGIVQYPYVVWLGLRFDAGWQWRGRAKGDMHVAFGNSGRWLLDRQWPLPRLQADRQAAHIHILILVLQAVTVVLSGDPT